MNVKIERKNPHTSCERFFLCDDTNCAVASPLIAIKKIPVAFIVPIVLNTFACAKENGSDRPKRLKSATTPVIKAERMMRNERNWREFFSCMIFTMRKNNVISATVVNTLVYSCDSPPIQERKGALEYHAEILTAMNRKTGRKLIHPRRMANRFSAIIPAIHVSAAANV